MRETIIIQFLEHAPAGFHGMVTHNEDDTYTILLDPNDSAAKILETYFHELNHIKNRDFAKDSVQEIESAM